MKKEKRDTITTILVIIGIIFLLIPIYAVLPMNVTYKGPIGEVNFTGIDGIILTIGIVLLFFAYFFYHKKLPWFK